MGKREDSRAETKTASHLGVSSQLDTLSRFVTIQSSVLFTATWWLVIDPYLPTPCRFPAATPDGGGGPSKEPNGAKSQCVM